MPELIRGAVAAALDAARGVDTHRWRESRSPDPDLTHYVPSGWRVLPRILDPREVGPTDSFLDVGAGKGRILVVAAERYRFQRVIGVEHDPELAGIARANLKRRHLDRVEVLEADARALDVPDAATVVYLYHPFGEASTRAFASRLAGSMARRPRRVRLILSGPAYPQAFVDHGFAAVRAMPRHHVQMLEAAVTEHYG